MAIKGGGAINTTVQKAVEGSSLDIEFKGTDSNAANLTLSNGGFIKSISVGSGSGSGNNTPNKLSLAGKTTTINDLVDINKDSAITFELNNGAELNFANGVVSNGTSTLSLANSVTNGSSAVSGTLMGRNTNITNLNFNSNNANNAQTLNVKNSSVSFQTINASNANGSSTLALNASDVTVGSVSGDKLAVNFVGGNATLRLNSKTTTLKSVNVSNSQATIDLSSPVTPNTRASATSATPRKTLTIGNNSASALSGNLNAIVFASKTEADKIVVNGTGSQGVLTISAQGNLDDILSITYTKDGSNNVQVAQIGNNNQNLHVQGGLSEIDGVVVDLQLTGDSSGNYYIGKSVSKGVDASIQQVASSALTVNYDLYIANFNSINKRMGELRNNPNSQGVWARVFGGAMSNNFGSGSKTNYVTAQAGYDYALSVGENAKNYIGVTIAYGKSWTKSSEGAGLSKAFLSNINSNMAEVGIYNSYVMDSGWYNDTILKFDYIMSDFTLQTGKTSADKNTNNFAMILSDEFGYRYEFGVSEKGSWYIDPQAEVAFGYFDQSNFNHALNSTGNLNVNIAQDSILTLRTRAGASLGKKFITEKGFASVYVGAFYEYDYIEGGNATATVTGVSNPLDHLSSNGRAIVNVGSNIGLTKNARLYIDIEKSFGDKQRTFMQFNLGARYSF